MNQVMYGFLNLRDTFNERAAGIPEVRQAIELTIQDHNQAIDSLINLFAGSASTDYKRRFRSAAAARLTGGDEHTVADPIKTSKYDIAFPLQMGLGAWGASWVARVKLTVRQVNDVIATLLRADIRWVRDHILAALYANVAWTHDDPEFGDLTIQGLANGDSTLYYLNGNDLQATDSHYAAQAAAISDAANPFPALALDIRQHPENGDTVVAFIPEDLQTSVTGLTEFIGISDPNIRTQADTLVGDIGATVPGEVLGYLRDSRVWVVLWRPLPSSYIIGLSIDGDSALSARVDPETELQGFQPQGRTEHFPFVNEQWARRIGFGANNRLGGYVLRIGNGAYAVPTGYASPMA